jgi:hypothetical protein
MDATFADLAQAIAAHLARVPAQTTEVDQAVRHLAHAASIAQPRRDFVCVSNRDHAAILAPAIDAGLNHAAAGIAAALAALSGPLPWRYSYPPRPGDTSDAPDLAERIAFAEVIGPRAPLAALGCRAGFTLMAPETFYPLHAHPAVELYLVISGHAQWITPDAKRIVPPGEFVLHQASQPHAMRTTAEPLLAMYGWRGDLDTPAYYL